MFFSRRPSLTLITHSNTGRRVPHVELGLALPQYDYSVPGQPACRGPRSSMRPRGPSWPATTRCGWPTTCSCRWRSTAARRATTGATTRSWPWPAWPAPPPACGWARSYCARSCATRRSLANALASLDVVSRGRLIIGIGAGWFEPEYRAAGMPFERAGVRVEQLDEAVQILDGTLPGGPFAFDGRHYRTTGARSLPLSHPAAAPADMGRGARQPCPGGDRCPRRRVEHARVGRRVDDYRERLAFFEEACRRVGRDPATVTRSANQRFDGSVANMKERMSQWRELGVTTLVVGLGALPFSLNESDDIERVASARP